MPRNLDLTALRAFVTVAESGGVTRAAGQLNLTQSAVSMQLKRLEDSLGQALLDRSGRRVALTAQGERLLSYGRRMLALNDEILALMLEDCCVGEIRLGVPSDIVYPYVPGILRQFAAEYPRVRVTLVSSFTRILKKEFAEGSYDLILTTESGLDSGGEALRREPLTWVGAPGGSAWQSRPLRLAFETDCIFRAVVQRSLDEAGIPWDMMVSADNARTVDATVSADLAVHANIAGHASPYLEQIEHEGALPKLGSVLINMYVGPARVGIPTEELACLVRQAYGAASVMAAQ